MSDGCGDGAWSTVALNGQSTASARTLDFPCGTPVSSATAEARSWLLVITPPLSVAGTPALVHSIGISVRLWIGLPAGLPLY